MADPSWSLLYLGCQTEFLRHLKTSPLAQSSPNPDVDWVITGVWSNTHNGVAGAQLTDDTAGETIRDVVARFRAAGVPGIWYVRDGDRPTDLAVRLERSGCTPERSGVVMGVARATLDSQPPARPPCGVRIVEVLDDSTLDNWFEAASGVWQETPDDPSARARPVQRALYASLGLGSDQRWRHWVALRGQAAVGMVSAFYNGQTIAVENVGVVPVERRRGIGRALTLTTVERSRIDARWVVLGPSPEGSSLYRSLGFTTQPCLPDREFYLPAPAAPAAPESA